MPYIVSPIFFIFFLFFEIGCSKLELTRAFHGEFNSKRNDKVIGEYCTSCHIHKTFDSGQHVAEVQPQYRRKLFRTETECRTCHFLDKQWVHSTVLRKTRRPRAVNRGDFKIFEKEYMKSPRNNGS